VQAHTIRGGVHFHRAWRHAGQMIVLVLLPFLVLTDGAFSVTEAAGPVRVQDDQHKVDPCAFAKQAQTKIAQFGYTVRDEHYGNFDRCDLLVYRPDHKRAIDVEFALQKAATPVDTSPKKQLGSVVIENGELADGGCDKVLKLPDWYVMDIAAKSEEGGELLCRIAGAASLAALPAYTDGSLLRQRDFLGWSLANANACVGLDSPTLTHLALDPTTVTPTFGGWGCEWGTDDRWVKVWFDQGPPPNADDDGTPSQFGTRNGFVSVPPDGSATCEIVMGYHPFTDANRNLMESVHVSVGGELGPDQARIAANDVATNI
jgi:hypothetical protein